MPMNCIIQSYLSLARGLLNHNKLVAQEGRGDNASFNVELFVSLPG